MEQLYPHFARMELYLCYQDMKEFVIHYGEERKYLLNIEAAHFKTMCDNIAKRQLVIPEEVFSEIQDFIASTLEPMITDFETVFASCLTEDICTICGNGALFFVDLDAITKFEDNMFETVEIINRDLELFSRRVIFPVLIS